MTTRREFLGTIPVAGAAFAVGSAPVLLTASTLARAEETTAPGPLWRSPSLVEETVTGPNGAITSRDISEVNDRLAMTEKRAIEVAPDVWLLAGWGIAHSMAIRAPEGWIIVDTGDSTRAAQEMRDTLEARSGRAGSRGGDPVHSLALRRRHGRLVRRGRRTLGPRMARQKSHGQRRALARLAGSIRHARFRSSPCSIRRKVPMPSPTTSRFTPGKAAGENQATAHPSGCSPTARSRPFTIAGETVDGHAQPVGCVRQRRLLLSAAPASHIQLHGAGLHLQRLQPARRPVP